RSPPPRAAAAPPARRAGAAPAGPATAVPRRAGRPRLTGAARGYLFVAPALAYLALTALYPLGAVISMSVQDVVLGHWRFAGGQQYLRALNDGLVWNSVKNTATFTVVSTALHLLLGLALALLLNATWFSRT